MKRFRIWQLTAILFMCGTSVALTSCSDDDNDDSASSQLTGKWYAEFAQSGTAPSFEGDGEEPYSKVVQYYEFDADGKGYWTRFVLNDYFNDPIYQQGSCIGGRDADGFFTYTCDKDGTVRIQLKNVYKDTSYDSEWTLHFDGTSLTGKDSGTAYILTPSTDFRDKLVLSWDDLLQSRTDSGGNSQGSTGNLNAGTPQRGYSLDWKIVNEDRPMVALNALTNGMISSDYDQIIFEYNSVGPDLNTPVRLTGSINMPRNVFNKEETPRHLLLLTQWTHASARERLTQDSSYELEVYMNASSRIITISTDLYGWTLTVDKPQAYCCPEITAVETLDCWDAAMEILRQKGYQIDGLPISNMGYSSAGMQAIGIQRFIDEHRPDIHINLTGAAASPFDINVVWRHFVESNKTGYNCSLPLIMVAYNETYQLGLDYKDIFMPPLCDHIQDWILSKRYNSDGINELIGPATTVDQILTPAARDWTTGIGKLMYDKFRENSLCSVTTRWKPNPDTQYYIMHSEGDSYMDWHVSQQMGLFLLANGCRVVTDFFDSGDHVYWGAPYFLLTSCLMMERCDSQEDSQEVVNTMQSLIQTLRDNPDALSVFK